MYMSIQGTPEGRRLKVDSSGFQYQADQDGKRWIFRYEYERNPPRPHPPTHFHVRGNLMEACLPDGELLEDIHFPVLRISIEAIIRVLVDQFHVPCQSPRSVWRAMLTESERPFLDIAHRAVSGPRR